MMAHLYVPFHNAGAEVMAHALLSALVDAGHQVDVLCSQKHPDVTGAYRVDGVTVYTARRSKADPFAWFGTEHQPDVVITHLENVHRAGVLAGRYGVPVVVLMHNDEIQSRELLRVTRPSLVVYNTHWLRHRVETWCRGRGIAPPRQITVRPPVDPARYAVTPGDAVTLVNVCPDKGSGVFYALAHRFPRRRFLAVAGAYGEQDIRAAPNVTMLGHVPPTVMRSLVYAQTRVLLMPSVYESYGRVAAEAICSGIPVIAHPTEGLREALGPAGIYRDRDDIDAWADALRTLRDPRAWLAASRRALRRAESLDPADELASWVSTVEEVSRDGSRLAAAGVPAGRH